MDNVFMILYIYILIKMHINIVRGLPTFVQQSVNHVQLFWDPMVYSLPGSVHGITQVRIQEWIVIFQGNFLTERSNPSLLHCRWTLSSKSQGKPLGNQGLPGNKVANRKYRMEEQKETKQNFKGNYYLDCGYGYNISNCVQIVQFRHMKCTVYHSYPNNETFQMHI